MFWGRGLSLPFETCLLTLEPSFQRNTDSETIQGPAGMFGHGLHLNGDYGSRVYPYHKHPDGTWFMFEIEENDTVANSWY